MVLIRQVIVQSIISFMDVLMMLWKVLSNRSVQSFIGLPVGLRFVDCEGHSILFSSCSEHSAGHLAHWIGMLRLLPSANFFLFVPWSWFSVNMQWIFFLRGPLYTNYASKSHNTSPVFLLLCQLCVYLGNFWEYSRVFFPQMNAYTNNDSIYENKME